MKSIALSLLLVFTTFTVVLSTYYLWQDAGFKVAMAIEEEDGHNTNEASIPFKAIFTSNRVLLTLLAEEETKSLATIDIDKHYEDVYLNSPFSPPDVM